MSKTVKIAIGVVAFFVVLAAFGAGKSSKSDSPSTTSTTVGVTLVPNGPSRSECASELNTLNGLMDRYTEVVTGITTTSEIRAAVTAGRSIVQAGRSIIAECGHYAPTQASAYGASLDQVSASLDQLDGSLS